MIIKLVSAFADLDQKLVCAVPDIDVVRKSLANIGKKMFISNMEEYILRFADEKGENVDYTRPRIDPAKKWNQQGIQAGTIIYVLKKAAELPEEEIEKIVADARAKQAEEAAQRSLNDDLEKEREERENADLELAIEEQKKALIAEQQQQQQQVDEQRKRQTPPRTSTPTRTVVPPPAPAPPKPQQQQQAAAATSSSTTTLVANRNALPPPPIQQQQQQFAAPSHNNSMLYYAPSSSSALNYSPPAPPSGNITVIDSPHASSSAPDMKTSEALIYQLREQNRTLRDQVFGLEQRNRELEARVVSNAYSSESSPAVVAQMQLKLRDAEIEIQRLRNNENFLRDQLNQARKNGGGGPENSTQSVLDKLDPQTRAMLLEDKEALDSLVERRRQNLASTLSLYQLAHDDVELSKIRIQQEKERRDSLLATSAYGASNNLRPALQITSGGSTSTTTSSRRR